MKNKKTRQGLNVSVNELRELADDLERETRQFNVELGEDETVGFDKKWSVNIINKTPECLDTWMLESQEDDEVEFSLTGKEKSGMSEANYDFTIFEGVSG